MLRMKPYGATVVRGWVYDEEKCKADWGFWEQRRKLKAYSTIEGKTRVFWEGKNIHCTNNAESSK